MGYNASNAKYGTGIQNWSAVNADATKSCMDLIGDNSRQAAVLPFENANEDKTASHMDCVDDNTRSVVGIPAVNADMAESCMEWI